MINTYEERLKISDVLGVQDHGTVIRVDWENTDEDYLLELVEKGELPEDYDENDVLTYLGYWYERANMGLYVYALQGYM